LEAVAAALDYVASALDDTARRRRYDDAWRLASRSSNRLIIQERDSSILPNADYALGGLREDLYSGHRPNRLCAAFTRCHHGAASPPFS